MSDLELPFRLPVSCVRIAGTRAFVHDAVLGRDDTSAQATVTLDVVGEHEPSLLRIAEGLLVDTGVAFEWTDDGRLVTSSVELTGRAGTVAVGVVERRRLDRRRAAGQPRHGAVVRRRGHGDGAQAGARAAPRAEPKARRRRRRRAGGRHAGRGRRAGGGRRARRSPPPTARPIPTRARRSTPAPPSYPSSSRGLADALRRVPARRRRQGARRGAGRGARPRGRAEPARAQVGALDEHFRAWRAGTIAQRLEDYEFLLDLDTLVAAPALPELDAGRLRSSGAGDAGNAAALAAVQAAFEALGVVVIVEDDPGAGSAGAAGAETGPAARSSVAENEILVRLPRRVRLTSYELDAGGELVKRSSNAALVMDARCRHATVRIAKTLFGKRAVKLGFSAGSALASLRVAATSEAAGRPTRPAALPGAVGLGAGALQEGSSTGSPPCAAPGSTSRSRVLTRELQLKRQEIAQAGLLATAGSYAELAQLKRQVALLEQRKALLALEAELGVAAPVASTAAASDAAADDATVEP